MGIFGSRKVRCPAGQWTAIISNFGTGMAKTFNVRFIQETGGTVSGEYMEKQYLWIFPKPPLYGQLAQQMQFQRDWINGIYSVHIKPDSNIIAEID